MSLFVYKKVGENVIFIIKVLRMIAVFFSCITLPWFYLESSDIPIIVDWSTLYAFMKVNLIIIVIAFIDLLLCIKRKLRGGYFTLCVELMILFSWILTFYAVNFDLLKVNVKYNIIGILLCGIVSSGIQVIVQLVSLIVFNKRRYRLHDGTQGNDSVGT